ncbi:hypothetical protein Patl1_19431 [Pistacia atlantica]|uniref:Uncharacterized protein n=1 Tax=Pistacia atlantica TaxID=434234 RepID=A0ACC1BYN1_9ROSI|nr:hypothetical protein Patl1_19431 [Pistacia atlantica]
MYIDYLICFLLLEGGISDLSLLDPSMRATPLAPSEWRKRLEAVKDNDEASNSNLNTNLILLYVRNGIHFYLHPLGKQPHPKPLKTKYPVFSSPLFLPHFSRFFLLLSSSSLPTLFHLPARKIEDVVITFNQIMNGTLVILMVQEDLMWTALGALHLGNLKVRYDQSLYSNGHA